MLKSALRKCVLPWAASERRFLAFLAAQSGNQSGSNAPVESSTRQEPAKVEVSSGQEDQTTQAEQAKQGKSSRSELFSLFRIFRLPEPLFSYQKSGTGGSEICEVKGAGRSSSGQGDSRGTAAEAAAAQWLKEHRSSIKTARKSRDNLSRDTPKRYVPSDVTWNALPKPVGFQLIEAHGPDAEVPELAHGLSKIISTKTETPVPLSSKFRGAHFDSFLKKIAQPDEINWAGIPPFIPPSQDAKLNKLAAEHGASFQASTSSISGLYSHAYMLLSNWKPVDISKFSSAFRNMPNQFTSTIRLKPAVVHLIPHNGIMCINAENEKEQRNKILMDLGKAMERMLTMDKKTFNSLMLKPLGSDEMPEFPEELLLGAYNFSISNGIMLRSQLDCVLGKNKIFDLKTRATHAIRNCYNILPDIPSEECHLHFTDYRITQQYGLWHSFERELYDMLRSAFLKYSCQLRIGAMDGAFVTYHNTQEIFGFQYITLDYMDTLLYGSPQMGRFFFDESMKIVSHILHEVIQRYGQEHPLRISMQACKQSRRMIIHVSRITKYEVTPPVTVGADPTLKIETGQQEEFHLFVKSYLNDKENKRKWNFGSKDQLTVKYAFLKDSECSLEPTSQEQIDEVEEEGVKMKPRPADGAVQGKAANNGKVTTGVQPSSGPKNFEQASKGKEVKSQQALEQDRKLLLNLKGLVNVQPVDLEKKAEPTNVVMNENVEQQASNLSDKGNSRGAAKQRISQAAGKQTNLKEGDQQTISQRGRRRVNSQGNAAITGNHGRDNRGSYTAKNSVQGRKPVTHQQMQGGQRSS